MDLQERVERLERQNRFLRFVCGFIAVAVICIAAMGAAGVGPVGFFKVVKAQKFELVDKYGRTRGEMSVNTMGPYLHFDDRQHGNLASMGIANGVPHVTLERGGRTKSMTP